MSQYRPKIRNCPELRAYALEAIESARFIPADAPLDTVSESVAASIAEPIVEPIVEPVVKSAAEPVVQSTVIGLDTEFVRERTFYPRPGLIQVFDGNRISLIDPIGRNQNNELSDLMKNTAIIKVFHSVGEDLEIMQLVCGALPRPLFDTQIAAAMLGFPLQYRYEVLVNECFGAELAGGQARSDWCKRPLAANLLRYAASDVAWLIELQSMLSAQLEKVGRLSWLEEDCQRLVDNAERGDTRPALLRVKGAGQLSAQGLGWLNSLSEWRERETRLRDLPRSFVIKDDDLIKIADHAAIGQLDDALDHLHHRDRQRHGKALEAILSAPAPTPIAPPTALQRLTPEQRSTLKAAQGKVRVLAEKLEIDPALIASKRELTQLLFGDAPDWAQGWRQQFLPDILP